MSSRLGSQGFLQQNSLDVQILAKSNTPTVISTVARLHRYSKSLHQPVAGSPRFEPCSAYVYTK